jgi:hypothetical protein
VCEESQARFDTMEFEQPPPPKHQKTTAVTMEDLKELLLVQTKGFADVLTATSSTANACNNLVQVITMQMQQAAALAKQRSDELDSSGVHHAPRVGQQSQTHPSQALQGAAPVANAANGGNADRRGSWPDSITGFCSSGCRGDNRSSGGSGCFIYGWRSEDDTDITLDGIEPSNQKT